MQPFPRQRNPRHPRRRQRWLTSIVVLLALLTTGVSNADPFADVRAYIEKQMADGHPASLTVAVSQDGETIWSESWGWADRERRIPAGVHTAYSLASISKPVTATGLMVLVERGKIDLELPVDDYLGRQKLTGFAGDAADASVRRVAGHMAGLPLHYQFFYEDEPFTRPSMEETIRRYGILVTKPGDVYQYSNLGYGILDYCIERQSGKPFADFMRSEVFLPLGMTHTSIGIDAGLDPYAAVRYSQDGTRIPFYDFDHRGASAVFASAHDLLRFGNFHIGILPDGAEQVLKKESRAAMRVVNEESKYGIGWRVTPHPAGVDVVSHRGGMGGVSTMLNLVPEKRLVVTALSNSRDSTAYRAGAMTVDTLLGEKTKSPTTRVQFPWRDRVWLAPGIPLEREGRNSRWNDPLGALVSGRRRRPRQAGRRTQGTGQQREF